MEVTGSPFRNLVEQAHAPFNMVIVIGFHPTMVENCSPFATATVQNVVRFFRRRGNAININSSLAAQRFELFSVAVVEENNPVAILHTLQEGLCAPGPSSGVGIDSCRALNGGANAKMVHVISFCLHLADQLTALMSGIMFASWISVSRRSRSSQLGEIQRLSIRLAARSAHASLSIRLHVENHSSYAGQR
ncbi:hypothetical protein EDC59_101272 [Pseudodesulfovibrio indicus]|uniref:Uncharacterized protein n=1 Tax=Pseudodesulfovibrio indicus TaxID=1716143 RepID=A0AA94TR44_9BACT|nr:hypothetical protein EDC59_101272 [Pseudodesulfovibrio indicus]